MIIPALGSESTVVKTDATGKIQGENKDGETLLSFIREIRQILENPAIQNMINKATPKNQEQTEKTENQEQTEKTENGFDETAIIQMLSTKEGCIKFAQGLDMVIGTFGDKKLSEFKKMILDQAGVTEQPEKKETQKDETKLD
jgi:hypothetical protein